VTCREEENWEEVSCWRERTIDLGDVLKVRRLHTEGSLRGRLIEGACL